jgi:prepilin-type N-terminal cleavage/methylation domain-containing protein
MLMRMEEMKGFTLIELMISIGVTAVLMGAVYMSVNSAQRHSSAIERKVTVQQDVKPALDLMAMEIGMASYNNPSATTDDPPWVNPPGGANVCGSVSVNQGYRGIQEATANSITVEMDIRGATTAFSDGIIGPVGGVGGENEIIRYNYVRETNSKYITRSTNCGSSQAFLGAASGNPRTLLVINDTSGIPVFRYYNGEGACILEVGEIPTGNCVGNVDATRLPAAIPRIRRIDITLAVETENVDATTGQKRRLIYSTSVIPRNHAITK